jgi:hypothetical protein
MSASPSDIPSQLEAPHPEFGYLAPTKRFRRKIGLTIKAAVFGALAGAVAMYFVANDRDERPVTMLATPVLIAPAASTPTPAAPTAPTVATPAPSAPASPTPAPSKPTRTAATDIVAPPVPYVPQTIALPQATPRGFGLRGSVAGTASGPMPSAPSTADVPPAASGAAAPAPVPTPVAKAPTRPKKKVVRERLPDPEPRAAYASPPPRPPLGLPIFGFGW